MKQWILVAITIVLVSLHALGDDRVLAIQVDDITKADSDLGAARGNLKPSSDLGATVSAEAKKLKDKKSANRKKRK